MSSWVSHGAEMALRSVALPFVLGCRWLAEQGDQGGAPPDGTGSGWMRRLKTAADELFFASEFLVGESSAFFDVGRLRAETQEAVAFFRARGWLDDPVTYHETPPPLREVAVDDLAARGGPYQHLRFESGYSPAEGEPGRERWLASAPNLTAHAWLLRHPGPPRPWIVCAAAYRMGDPSVDFLGFRARWLHHSLGVNVAIPVVPFHGPRRVGRRGGDGFMTGDFVDTVHAVAQTVWDVRRLIDWLRHEGAPAIGVYGLSLGGCTSALVASLEATLDCVVVGIPAVDFAGLMRWNLRGPLVQATERLGFPWEDVATLLRVVSPLAVAPRVAKPRRFLFGAAGDTLAPPGQTRALWRHWDEPRLLLYDGGHVSFLFEAAVRDLLVEALATTGFLPSRSDAA
ncbi:MAG: alpha/beta hydrolase family protein [Deltaproteobacteria bacterium]|nr:alpha/beta hydrolase family protein [Deltaproteobacteria bacterium]